MMNQMSHCVRQYPLYHFLPSCYTATMSAGTVDEEPECGSQMTYGSDSMCNTGDASNTCKFTI